MDEEELFYGKKFQKLDSLMNEIFRSIYERDSKEKYIKKFYETINNVYIPLKTLIEIFEKKR